MGKKNNSKNDKNNQKNRNNEFEIPEDAKKLAKLNFKKFKKQNKDYYDGKKKLKKAYYAHIIELLPESIALLVKYGHLDSVKETKNAIYGKITNDSDFITYLIKEVKEGYDFDNIGLLPNIIYDIIGEANKAIEAAKVENPDVTVEFDLQDLIELSRIILKKKIKRMEKDGIDTTVAFDVLSVIPTTEILKKSQYFHIRQLFTVLYEHAKTKEINFEKIMEILFKDDDYVNSVITFALLERKEKIQNFSEGQKKLFNDITEYCFKTMEELKKEEIYAILKSYISARKKDESQGRDTNRRYYISSLPESDYPKILKVMKKLIEDNEDVKKYF